MCRFITIFQRLTHGLVRWLLLPVRLSKDARPLIRARGSLKYASNFWTIFPFPLSFRPQWGCSIMAELSWANFSWPCTVKSFLCLHIPPHLFIWFVGNKWPGLLKPPLYPSILFSHCCLSAFIPSSMLFLLYQGRPQLTYNKRHRILN